MTGYQPIVHGTNNGYTEHCRRGDACLWQAGELEPCAPCRKAHAAYMRQNRAVRRLLAAHRVRTIGQVA